VSVRAAKREGRALRAATPRSALGVLAARPTTYDPISRLIWLERNRRVELLAIRYQRMLASPLAFFRGAALLMAEDLARGVSTPLLVQVSGDAHLANFGVFASPERRLVFDLNDFDETAIGPFEWDVKRLATSVVIAGDQLGLSKRRRREAALVVAHEYQRSMARLATLSRLDAWYLTFDVSSLDRDLRGYFRENTLERADALLSRLKPVTKRRAFKRLVAMTDDGPRLRSKPPHLVPARELGDDAALVHHTLDIVLAGYPATLVSDRAALFDQFTPVDAARQVVGVGSVGRECYVVLLTGRDENDLFMLQVKEARPSVVAIARGVDEGDPGERLVEGQRFLQARPDPFLGWHTLERAGGDTSFYVRQLYDHKASVDLSMLNARGLRSYTRACAWALARAHARSSEPARIAGYLGSNERFAESVVGFAEAYRKRNLADFAALGAAAREGRVPVLS
jgi:uncharacterized protein (DUF2252 family)